MAGLVRSAIPAVAAALFATQALSQCLVPAGEATVVAVPSAEAVALDDGRVLRLADIRAADADAMRAALAELVGDRVSVAEVVPGRVDRWGRRGGDATPLLHADVAPKDTARGLRIAIVSRGLALVDPVDMSGACLAELFGAERAAEADRRGVWRTPPILPAAAEGLAKGLGRYVLVDGTVASVGETGETVYLNFGENWRTDFTALISRRDASAWGFDAPALSGKRVRVRGVLEAWNGGLIRIEHPAQVDGPRAEPRVGDAVP